MSRAPLAAVLIALALPGSAQDLDFFTLGSGDVGGGYYSAANAICESVNRAERGELRCSPEATPGSLYNLAALREGQLDFALVQSDLQRAALDGSGTFADEGPMADLRSVMSLYPEALTVLARGDITNIGDLLGKRVDIGVPASGRHATVERLLESLQLGPADFAALLELPTGAAIDELCAGRIDATFLIVGHPNAGVATALADCNAILVPFEGPKLEAVLAESADHVRTVIPLGTYASLSSDIPTFAVTATLVTRLDIEDDLVRRLVVDTLANMAVLANRAPVLERLTPAEMKTRGLTAPLHPGAGAAFALFPQ